ncbi:cobalamin B12-binding domain-containing protein [Thalassococcus sp. CAU 1522]|uniref:Cobalamin B12-binding domain-containing protein n=1 Tax=Thalassococcus arenae TaxID=2851652 RepID=A0ABS6N6T1_9RHOB|nr:cobalamin B12-binding domain-containing protein [Thalassococcus arenae]MBV2359372.1 cobalamin B12-binding domain-containing protein [Thalassococcus arenae]
MSTDNSSEDRDAERGSPFGVSVLASTVISVLNGKQDDVARSMRNSVVRSLVRSTLRAGAFNAEVLLNDLRDSRIEPNDIVDLYIPEAARALGEMWVEDAIGFAKVTIATARLQGLLTLLAPPWAAVANDQAEAINTLLILQADDSHTLGPHVATAQLRRLGASVRLLFGPDERTIVRVLRDDPYDLIMFSCSRADALAPIAQMVKRVRAELNGAPPIALGGLVLGLAERVKERTGVDLVTNDVRVAFKLCERKRHKFKSAAR